MKTLDKVIAELEDAPLGEFSEVEIDYATVQDALTYLKEYRMQLDDIVAKRKALDAEKDRYAEAVRNCEKAENKYRKMEDELNNIRREHISQMKNDPLTWDELKQMEGKPVWVEESAENGLWWTYWVIWQGDNAVLPEKDYSTKWQAYRKERE